MGNASVSLLSIEGVHIENKSENSYDSWVNYNKFNQNSVFYDIVIISYYALSICS